MSVKDDKTDSFPSTLSPLSSSGLPASDRSLERVLGAIEQAIRSFTQVANAIHSEVTKQGTLNMARHEMAIKVLGKMRIELATLADQLRTLVTGQGISLGATVESRQALDRTREKLEVAVKDLTGSHALQQIEDEEGAAPPAIRKLAVQAANFIWPSAVRGGKAAIFWGLKLVMGSTVLAGIAKLLHMTTTGNLD